MVFQCGDDRLTAQCLKGSKRPLVLLERGPPSTDDDVPDLIQGQIERLPPFARDARRDGEQDLPLAEEAGREAVWPLPELNVELGEQLTRELPRQ
jgi:hypothetical protein